MTATTYTPAKPCKVCGTSERYSFGTCKHCKLARGKAVFANGPRAIPPSTLFLAALPGDRKHIRAVTGLCEATVYRCQRLLRAEGKVHIGSYRKLKGRPDPTYVAGPGRDAKKPPLSRVWEKEQRLKAAAKKRLHKPESKPAPRPRPNRKSRAKPVPLVRLVEAAVAQSRAAFPLCAVWG